MNLDSAILKSIDIIDDAIEMYSPVSIQAGFSGGTDSLVVTHLIMNTHEAEVFHINTGIGVEKTREYVRTFCKENEWVLNEIRAKEDCGKDYEEMVLEHGFPGPSQHSIMYRNLKERGIRELCRRKQNKRGDKVLLVTGIREDESFIRSGYKNDIVKANGREVWVNAIYHFTKSLKQEYIVKYGLEINPVSKLLGISGECLCGAFAGKSELDLVRIIEPNTAEWIDNLQKRVWEAGHHWLWHEKPHQTLINEKHGQIPLIERKSEFMCVGCTKNEGVFEPNIGVSDE
ncbi:MAG: phosphoadenosine phosphosulfate reductase family protein [Balneola sp.]